MPSGKTIWVVQRSPFPPASRSRRAAGSQGSRPRPCETTATIVSCSGEQVITGVTVDNQKRRLKLVRHSKAWCVNGSSQRTQASLVARNFSQALEFDACSLKASLIHRWKLRWKRSVRLKDRQLTALCALRRWNYSATAFFEISSEFSIGFATHCVEVELS